MVESGGGENDGGGEREGVRGERRREEGREGRGREWWAVREERGGIEWWGCGLIVVPSFCVLVAVSSSHIVIVLLSHINVACGCCVQ